MQFKAQSDAHRQVGEYLEHLGNKKSEAVVIALVEYLKAHPEALNKDNPVKAIAAYGFTEETLNTKIADMVQKIADEKNLRVSRTDYQEINEPLAAQPEDDANAIDALLGGLDAFLRV